MTDFEERFVECPAHLEASGHPGGEPYLRFGFRDHDHHDVFIGERSTVAPHMHRE